jgi:hypothetical protein
MIATRDSLKRKDYVNRACYTGFQPPVQHQRVQVPSLNFLQFNQNLNESGVGVMRMQANYGTVELGL